MAFTAHFACVTYGLLTRCTPRNVTSCSTLGLIIKIQFQEVSRPHEWQPGTSSCCNVANECEICLRTVVSSAHCGDRNLGLAMMDCGHWFCEECWRRHLMNMTRQSGKLIQCPVSTRKNMEFRNSLLNRSFMFVLERVKRKAFQIFLNQYLVLSASAT